MLVELLSLGLILPVTSYIFSENSEVNNYIRSFTQFQDMDKQLQYQKIEDNYLETIPEIVTSHPVDQVPEVGPVVEPVIVLLGEDTDKTVRQQFISKVYTTLWLQLATTTGITR